MVFDVRTERAMYTRDTRRICTQGRCRNGFHFFFHPNNETPKGILRVPLTRGYVVLHARVFRLHNIHYLQCGALYVFHIGRHERMMILHCNVRILVKYIIIVMVYIMRIQWDRLISNIVRIRFVVRKPAYV